MLGEHNHLIATGLLGCSEEEYEAYVAAGAMGVTPEAAGMKPPPAGLEDRLNLPPAAQMRIRRVRSPLQGAHDGAVR